MRQSTLFACTKKMIPKEMENPSHQLLVRGDFIEQLGAGIYTLLPLGFRVHKKIEEIIREEMNNLGAQELSMPALHPKSVWEETGRWETIDPPLFRVKDRHGRELALAPTHEEVITDLIRSRIQSWRDLPLALYQIQTKFRNEMRASSGLLRVREFSMKDLYSFHTDEKDLERFYQKVVLAYRTIFRRVGLREVYEAKASGGTIGGKVTHEFMVPSPFGEDRMMLCLKKHVANLEIVGREFIEGSQKICPWCKHGCEILSTIEIGHTFQLGDIYCVKMNAFFKDRKGKEKPVLMGCYGIGLGRLLATIVEKNYDGNGIIWPVSVAPFDVHLLEISAYRRRDIQKTAAKLYETMLAWRLDVLYDDRIDKTPGEKFMDADLIGIPIRIVVSERTLAKKAVELKMRKGKIVKLISIKSLRSYLSLKSNIKNPRSNPFGMLRGRQKSK